MSNRRWDDDEVGRGVGDARGSLPAIQQLAELAGTPDWVAEDPESHLLPGIRDRLETSQLALADVEVEPDGALLIRLTSKTQQSRRGLRQAAWSVLGGVAELDTFVRETSDNGAVSFEVVTGIPPGGSFATHGHVIHLRVEPKA